MRIPTPTGGRADVGETVAGFPTYEAAQKAVSALVEADVAARDIAIVGIGLRSVERITGKLGYATAARSGAVNGLLLGLFFSALFVLGEPNASTGAFIGVLFVGVALGMLLSIGAYAIVRRRRDFASVMQVVADRYEVTVARSSVHRAREVLGGRGAPATSYHAASAPPNPTPRPSSPDDEPPQYGERIAPPGPPRYGERLPDPEPPTVDEPTGEEPDPGRAHDDGQEDDTPER